MPYTGARGLGETEWREDRARLELHLKCHPEYDAGWRRPAEATAKRVWKRLAPAMRLRLGELVPDHDWLEPDESDALAGPVESPVRRVGRRCRRGMDLDDLYVWRGHEPNAGARTPPLGQVC